MSKLNLTISVLAVLAVGTGALALTANGSQEDCCAPPDSRPSTVVTYESGGGFAPSYTRIEVGTDGVVTVEQGATPQDARIRTAQLSDDDLNELRDVLVANPIEDFPGALADDDCYDCLSHSLSYQGDAYEWDSGSPSSQSRASVVEAITDLPVDLRANAGSR